MSSPVVTLSREVHILIPLSLRFFRTSSRAGHTVSGTTILPEWVMCQFTGP